MISFLLQFARPLGRFLKTLHTRLKFGDVRSLIHLEVGGCVVGTTVFGLGR